MDGTTARFGGRLIHQESTLKSCARFMSFRPENEIKSSFAQAAQTLDLMLERTRPQLEINHILFHDQSNRSGFEKSGVPYYLWEYRFEKRTPYGSEIKLA